MAKRRVVTVLTLCLLPLGLAGATGAQNRRASSVRAELARADRLEIQAKALYDAGRYDEGIRLEVEVLEIRVKRLGPVDPVVAVTLDNLAALYADKGDYVRAEQLINIAWQIAERTLPPDHYYATRILYNQASMYDDRGDYARAKQLYQRVLALRENVAGKRSIDVALSRLCQSTSAEPDECQQHLDVALTLNDLGAVHEHEGDYDQAEKFFNRALEISEKILPPEHSFISQLLNNLAVVYDDKNDQERAEQLFQRVLTVRRQSLGENHPKVALSLNNIGTLYVRKGELKRAGESYERALEMAQQTLPAQHIDIALILNNLGVLAMFKGEHGQARQLLAQASSIQEHHLSLMLAIGSEKQKQLYLDTLVNDTNQTVSLHALYTPHNEAAAQLALMTILQRKGRTLDATTDQRNALRNAATPQERKLLDQLQAVGTRLANRQVSGPLRGQSLAAWRAAIARDTVEFERLEGEIGRRSVAFRAQVLPVTLETVREQIPADAALIEFFEYLPFDPKGKDAAARWGAPRYVAYVVRRDGVIPQGVELGAAATIDEKVKSLRAALRNPERADNRELARALDELVMQPIRRVLGSNTQRLIISPDGALNLIPFAALVNERDRYLVEDYSLTYLTSGRDLLRLRGRGASQPGPSRPLILADPAYDVAAAQSKRAGKRLPFQLDENRRPSDLAAQKFAPLRGTDDEAAVLAKLLPEARVLTQTQATESALKQARSPRLLHIATHGYFLPDNPQQGAATSSGASGKSSLDSTQTQAVLHENPLLRAGLALSGANHLRGGNGEDGILTGLEVAGLNLSGTKLVVLSACESGVGEVQNGKGVYGLRRALVLAGSESQVISLWKVNDDATRDFMIRYYKLLLAGQGRSEALRQVQLEMLAGEAESQKQSHPYFWASFIQSGEWKNLDGRDSP